MESKIKKASTGVKLDSYDLLTDTVSGKKRVNSSVVLSYARRPHMLGELGFTVNVADRWLPDITTDLIIEDPTTLI